MNITPPPSTPIFSPIVKIASGILGQKKLNTIRGKAISLHSQVIGDFCKYIGANNKIRQGLIRVAKTNGLKLGFID
jgi:hypothetical protein